MREHSFDLSSVNLTPQSLDAYDAVVLATDHDEFDYDLLQKHSQIIIDTRGKYTQSYSNVIKA
jgi:UDP-N-acetyl-D-glucosamine dehydrogenase